MKITRNHLTIGFLAIVAVLAVFALAGHPILPVDALAGLGMLPLAMSGEIDMKEIKTLLEVQGAALEKFKKSVEADILAIATKNGPTVERRAEQPDSRTSTPRHSWAYMRSGREADLEQKVMRTDSGPEGGYPGARAARHRAEQVPSPAFAHASTGACGSCGVCRVQATSFDPGHGRILGGRDCGTPGHGRTWLEDDHHPDQ
jgi:hypothetical protein